MDCSMLGRYWESLRFIEPYWGWLTQLWRPRSPTVCHLQAVELGKLGVQFRSHLKAWELGHWYCKSCSESESLRTGSSDVGGQEKTDGWVQAESEFARSLSFCSVQALNGLDGAYLRRWVQSSLVNLNSKSNVLAFSQTQKKCSASSLGMCAFLVTQLCPTLCNSMDYSPQAPLSMEFSREEFWNRLPFPPPDSIPNLGIESASLVSPALAGEFFITAPSGSLGSLAQSSWYINLIITPPLAPNPLAPVIPRINFRLISESLFMARSCFSREMHWWGPLCEISVLSGGPQGGSREPALATPTSFLPLG